MKIQIRVRANAKQNKVDGEVDGRLIVFVQAPAEDGKANQSVIEVLAKHFKVKKRDVKILSGEKNRDKIVEIELDK